MFRFYQSIRWRPTYRTDERFDRAVGRTSLVPCGEREAESVDRSALCGLGRAFYSLTFSTDGTVTGHDTCSAFNTVCFSTHTLSW